MRRHDGNVSEVERTLGLSRSALYRRLKMHGLEDEGPGIGEAQNLFVPFFTTKPEGSGIGLALSRQIAEGHGGGLTLRDRASRGCRAELTLPLEA